jgi:DNA-binding NarL/FixJ family response regulator
MIANIKPIKVMIVDDHEIFRNALKLVLQRFKDVKVIAEASNGIEFITMCHNMFPDLVFMDVKMPFKDGLEATKYAGRYWPEMKIIALTMFKDKIYIKNLIDAGVKGILFKESFESELGDAIYKVYNGEMY